MALPLGRFHNSCPLMSLGSDISTFHEVTCILTISSDPWVHVISYHSPQEIWRGLLCFWVWNNIRCWLDYINFINVLLLNTIFLYKSVANVSVSNLLYFHTMGNLTSLNFGESWLRPFWWNKLWQNCKVPLIIFIKIISKAVPLI